MRNPAEELVSLTQELLQTSATLSQAAALYAEKAGGFQCGTCRYAVRGEVDGNGGCDVVSGPIDMNEGCCVLWTADPRVLQAVGR